jgi:hypothetical protein
VYPGETANFISTMPVVDIRFGFGRLISKGRKGFYLGVDAGYAFSIANGGWRNFDNGTTVNGVDPSGYQGFYLKVNIGGGRFKLN